MVLLKPVAHDGFPKLLVFLGPQCGSVFRALVNMHLPASLGISESVFHLNEIGHVSIHF
jgi:hypothetical protein